MLLDSTAHRADYSNVTGFDIFRLYFVPRDRLKTRKGQIGF